MKTNPLDLEQELALIDAYFFLKEQGFKDSDKTTIKTFEYLLKTLHPRFEQCGLKFTKVSKKLKMSKVTLWRRFKKKNWQTKEEITTLVKLLNFNNSF